MSTTAEAVQADQAQHDADNDFDNAAPAVDGTTGGEDAEKGQLFEVPRIAIVIDDSDPSVIKINFSGGIELDRAKPGDVNFYNSLVAGKSTDLEIEAHVAGAKRSHRRDSDGNVDAVVETKSLIVHSIINT